MKKEYPGIVLEKSYWSSPAHCNSVTSDPERHGDHAQSRHAWKVSSESGNVLSLTQHLKTFAEEMNMGCRNPQIEMAIHILQTKHNSEPCLKITLPKLAHSLLLPKWRRVTNKKQGGWQVFVNALFLVPWAKGCSEAVPKGSSYS